MKLGDLWDRFGDGTPNPLLDRPDSPRRDLFVFGVSEDSRDVRFGSVFCALSGSQVNGLAYCPQAAAKGAQAIVVPAGARDEEIGLSAYERTKIVVIRVQDIRRFYARLAAFFHPGQPDTLVAVTGTNGKTSTVCFVRDLWQAAGLNALSLGTLGLRSKTRTHTDLEAVLTTFDPKTLHIMLGELRQRHKISHLALEASSHALDQQRLGGLTFAAAGFTNLSQDHLDYHQTMRAYFEAKARLFDEALAGDGVAVINSHDEAGRELADRMQATGRRLIRFGHKDETADIRLTSQQAQPNGQALGLSVFGTAYEISAPVAGLFQAENIMCALGLAIATGLPADQAVAGIAALASVPGRLEHVTSLDNGAEVFVDYAHTPDALANLLHSLRPHVPDGARLHVVFGCGGDRDPDKRPQMGRIAVQTADQVWVTDDNPRTEDAAAIRREVLAGASGAREIAPREAAIEQAMQALRPGDILVIAGKGHEDYQILPVINADGEPVRDEQNRIRTSKLPFSDSEVVLRGVTSR